MNKQLQLLPIGPEALLQHARKFRKQGYRLVQISAVRTGDAFELTYSFDKEGQMEHLRLSLPAVAARVPSITPVFSCAFLYENELHDLFDIEVEGLSVDFHGHLYKTAVKFPFGSTKAPRVKTQSAESSPAARKPVEGTPLNRIVPGNSPSNSATPDNPPASRPCVN